MNLKHLITAASIALLPLAAGAATFIVPASGTGAGANDSRWQSELTLHNTASTAATIGLAFHDASGAQQSDPLTLNARSTVSIADIVKTRFGRESGTGAIEIVVPDTMPDRVTITSRTFNSSAAGQFGQDIPAINADDAASAGDVIILQAPSSATDARFNFGVYALTDSSIRWDLVRADGTVAKSLEQSYNAGTQIQYGSGISTFLGDTEQDNDTLQATVTKGKVIAYGSAINNQSGDPTFVPGIRARVDIHVNFIGIDLNQDGKADVTDADHDGVLDQAVDAFTTMGYPNYFRILVTGANGEAATLELVDVTHDAQFIDADTLQFAPSSTLKGTSGTVKVRATVGGVSDILTIPVNFR